MHGLFKILVAGTISGASSIVVSANASPSENFELKMELAIDGQLVSSPRVVVKEGEKAIVTQKSESGTETYIEVTATERHINTFKSIWLKMAVARVGKDGERTTIAEPQVVTFLDEKAEVTVGDEGSKERLSLSVVASKKQ